MVFSGFFLIKSQPEASLFSSTPYRGTPFLQQKTNVKTSQANPKKNNIPTAIVVVLLIKRKCG
jgi:hypothetical protein